MPTSISISDRLSRGLGSQAYGQGVQILIRFAEVPLLLHFWGAQLYGEWLMLSTIPAYLAISDGGFAGAASRDMSMRSGAGNRTGALAVFQSTAIFLAFISLVVIIVAFVLTEFTPVAEWFGFQEIGASTLRVVLFLLVLHVIVAFQGGLINGGFWCSGSYPLGMMLASSTQLVEFLALAAAVALGGGPVQAAAAYLAGRVFGTSVTRLVLKRATPWLYYGLDSLSFGEIRRLAAPAFASLSFPLGNALNIQGMRLIVGVVLGPAAVAVFAPLRTLSNLATQPRAVITRLIEPELGLAFGRSDEDTFGRLFLHGCQTVLWLCGFVVIVLLVIGPWFWPIWTGGKAELRWPLFLLLLTGALVNSVWYPALMVPYATNRHGRIAMIYSAVYGAGALGITYLGVAGIGLSGAGIGLLISEIAMAFLVLPAALKMGRKTWGRWSSTISRPPTFVLLRVIYGLSGISKKGRITMMKGDRK